MGGLSGQTLRDKDRRDGVAAARRVRRGREGSARAVPAPSARRDPRRRGAELGSGVMTILEPDLDQLEIFVDALFRHTPAHAIAGHAFVSIRSFYEGDEGKPFRITAASLAGGLRFVLEVAQDDAYRAANSPKPAVFCPPVAVFTNDKHAGEKDLALGPALSVECDTHGQEAGARLEQLLGAATVVVRSGGGWTDPKTGEGGAKLHLHYRLKQPAKGKDQLGKLKRARILATQLVGGDPSNKPV